MTNVKESIYALANMYSDFVTAAYKRLIEGGFTEEMARLTAMQMLKEHMKMSAELAASKNKSMEEIMAGITKGGSA